MKRSRIDLRVRDDQKDDWVAAASRMGLDLSELIRRATDTYIAKRRANIDGAVQRT